MAPRPCSISAADSLMLFRLKRSELLSLKLTLCARLGEGQSVHACHRSPSESVVGCACADLRFQELRTVRVDKTAHSMSVRRRYDSDRMSRASTGAASELAS